MLSRLSLSEMRTNFCDFFEPLFFENEKAKRNNLIGQKQLESAVKVNIHKICPQNIEFIKYFSECWSATIFPSHARTSHFEVFARTHFARTCAFSLLSHRTRTRTYSYTICILFYTSQ